MWRSALQTLSDAIQAKHERSFVVLRQTPIVRMFPRGSRAIVPVYEPVACQKLTVATTVSAYVPATTSCDPLIRPYTAIADGVADDGR